MDRDTKATQSGEPTFIVRLVAPDILPHKIPFRIVSAALSAVQDLASGRDPLETRQVPDEKVIGLVNVRKGSAIYSCISRSPSEAKSNLRLVGNVLAGARAPTAASDDRLAKTLKPIEKLSDVAKSFGGRVEVALAQKPREPLFVIEKDDFSELSKRLFLEGETTIAGVVQRVGGSTGMKCALSVAGRHRLLFCDVKSKTVAQRLGQHLYQPIAATGKVVWIHSSWHIYKFTVSDFSQPKIGDVSAALKRLRATGLNAWDDVSDIDDFLEEARG